MPDAPTQVCPVGRGGCQLHERDRPGAPGDLGVEGDRQPPEREERQALLAGLDAQGGLPVAACELGLHANTMLRR
jgi:hypothetical protein